MGKKKNFKRRAGTTSCVRNLRSNRLAQGAAGDSTCKQQNRRPKGLLRSAQCAQPKANTADSMRKRDVLFHVPRGTWEILPVLREKA